MASSSRRIIQDYVSRPQSLGYHLSQHTWQDGLDTFFSHRIPFSYSTSLELAERYLALIESYYQDNKPNTLTIVELGAGLGLLTYHLCYLLHHRNHHLYDKISFIITDLSSDLVSTLDQHPLYKQFKNKVTWQAFNCLGDDYTLIKKASVVIMNYLCDSLNTHHLEYRQGRLFEWQVATYIDRADYYFDTRVFPPQFMKGQPLYDYLISVQEALKSKKAPPSLLRLSYLLHESWKKIPADQSLSTHQLSTIQTFIKKSHMPPNQRFNFSFDIDYVMGSILTHLSHNTLVLIYDFGISAWSKRLAPKKRFLASYGMNQFYSVCFPYIQYQASRYHYRYLTTHFQSGHSQFMVLYNHFSCDPLLTTFKSLFRTSGYQQTSQVIKTTKHFIANHESSGLSEFIQKQYAQLSYGDKRSYNLLVFISETLLNHQFFEDSLYYIHRLEDYYGTFARAGFYLKAKLLNTTKQHDDCISFIQRYCLDTCHHAGILYQYLLALCYVNDYSTFLTTFQHFLTVTDYFIPWRFFLITIAILEHQQSHENATQCLQWLHALKQDFPDLLPNSVTHDIPALS